MYSENIAYAPTATAPHRLLQTVQDCAATCEHMTCVLHSRQDMYGRGSITRVSDYILELLKKLTQYCFFSNI